MARVTARLKLAEAERSAARAASQDELRAELSELDERIVNFEDVKPKQKELWNTHGNNWNRYVEDTGLKVDAKEGPSEEQVARYASYMYNHRACYSTLGRSGVGFQYKRQVWRRCTKLNFKSLLHVTTSKAYFKKS